MAQPNIFDLGLDKGQANFTPLSPLSFLERTAAIYPDYRSVIYNAREYTWAETYVRCRQLASALTKRGIGAGDTVSVMSANLPEMYEAHFGVPMAGAVLNTINTRLDAAVVGFILDHAEARVLFVDPECSAVAKEAVALADRPDLLVIDIVDDSYDGGVRIGALTYEALLSEGDADFDWSLPVDEWDAISLNYTSGTTGNPKGVVYHHRGATLNAMSNILTWGMQNHPTYLWTLPMFHCNGWCFPWTLAANAGTSICLRAVRDEPIYDAFRDGGVTHFCGAPIVLNMLANAPDQMKQFDQDIKAMTAGAPPPAAVIKNMEAMGIEVTHVYGLTETYGPSVVCAWKDEWNQLPADDQAALKVRQGVRYVALSGLMVADPDTLEPVP
ncbi:MAG: AMP-binding protein, partial [Pseudomonadota bacterium]